MRVSRASREGSEAIYKATSARSPPVAAPLPCSACTSRLVPSSTRLCDFRGLYWYICSDHGGTYTYSSPSPMHDPSWRQRDLSVRARPGSLDRQPGDTRPVRGRLRRRHLPDRRDGDERSDRPAGPPPLDLHVTRHVAAARPMRCTRTTSWPSRANAWAILFTANLLRFVEH
jgi:hypothetical protein